MCGWEQEISAHALTVLSRGIPSQAVDRSHFVAPRCLTCGDGYTLSENNKTIEGAGDTLVDNEESTFIGCIPPVQRTDSAENRLCREQTRYAAPCRPIS